MIQLDPMSMPEIQYKKGMPVVLLLPQGDGTIQIRECEVVSTGANSTKVTPKGNFHTRYLNHSPLSPFLIPQEMFGGRGEVELFANRLASLAIKQQSGILGEQIAHYKQEAEEVEEALREHELKSVPTLMWQ